MKKHLVTLSIILFSFAIYSCKDKDAFTISGEIKNPGSVKKVFLLKADTNVAVIDSANLSDGGKFQFKEHSPYAGLFKIRLGGVMFDLIAKNGDEITFTTSLADKANAYQVTGSAESEKIKEFNRVSNQYSEKPNKVANEFQEKAQSLGDHPTQKQQDSLVAIYKPQLAKYMDEYSVAILKFANDNKQSLAGFYAINAVDSIKYESQLVAFAEAIKPYFKDNPLVQQFINSKMALAPVTIGHKAPDFTVGGIDGKPIKLSDYKGKYIMVDFWASWCVPCRNENPNVVKQYAIYKPLGLNILGISLDQDKGKWQQAVNADKLTWAHGSDLKNFEGPTERLYHIFQIPTNYIINPDGVIVAKNVFGADLEEFLNKTFSKSQQIVKIK